MAAQMCSRIDLSHLGLLGVIEEERPRAGGQYGEAGSRAVASLTCQRERVTICTFPSICHLSRLN